MLIRFIAGLGILGVVAALAFSPSRAAEEPSKPQGRVFEMRTYFTHEGRLDALNKRFRDHTCKLFQKHGMELMGFYTPVEEKDGKSNKLVYLLAYPSMEAREVSWKAFQADPAWKTAREASEKDGKIVAKVESVFLAPTDYSTVK